MDTSSLILIGIGTSGCRMARGVARSLGGDMRLALVDTDANTGLDDDDNFILLGGDRLSGHGAGGDFINARMATEESISTLDDILQDTNLAIIVTSLGGGTGSGSTIEVLKRCSQLDIRSIVFATTPFVFEGEDRKRNARGVMSLIEEAANSVCFLPLDKLVGGEDNMEMALKRASDTVANGVTLFWRLLGKPGYIRLEADRIRHLLTGAGRGRFACVTVQGSDRASQAVDELMRSELLATANGPVRSILCGVLGGEDLRLSELQRISDGIRGSFGEHVTFDLGTVNDEETFCGRLSVVVMLFEANGKVENNSTPALFGTRRQKKGRYALNAGPIGRGRFTNAEPTNINGEDLDVPTFVRKNINLDF